MNFKFLKEKTLSKAITKAKPYALSLAIASAFICSNVAFAAGGATTIFQIIIQFLGVISLAGAAVTGATSAIAYSEAKADTDGPAMSKAENKIKAAIAVAVVGTSLLLGAPTLASLISNSINF